MTKIVVCPLSRIHEQVSVHQPDRIVSLLDPGADFPETGYGLRHLKLAFHDVEQAEDWEIAPNMEHVREIIAFVRSWKPRAPLLIHCHAGISRSTASAYLTACALNPKADEAEIARAMQMASANARPNPLVVALGDDALRREGRMKRAIANLYRKWGPPSVIENEPFQLAAAHASGDA